MRVSFTAWDAADMDFTPDRDDLVKVLGSLWPGFAVDPEDVLPESESPDDDDLWSCVVPASIAGSVRDGSQATRWQTAVTIIAHDGRRRDITINFDPATAVE